MGDAPQPHELGYIANVLSGDAPPRAQSHRQQRQHNNKRRNNNQQRAASSASSRNFHHVPRPMPRRNGDAGAGPSSSHHHHQEQQHRPEGPHNQPSDQSTPTIFHCATCDVWVPHRQGDWETHIAGIRHRRHALSLREHGERDRLVVSTFEYNTTTPAAARNNNSTFNERRGRQQQQRDSEIESMRSRALARILDSYGSGQIYAAGNEILSRESLHQARARVAELLNSLSSCPANADHVNTAEELFTSPTALVAAAYAVETFKQPIRLPPLLILKMPPTDENTSSMIATWLCALILFLVALADHNANVTTIAVCIDMNSPVNVRPIIHQALVKLVYSFRSLLQNNTRLETFRVYLTGAGSQYSSPLPLRDNAPPFVPLGAEGRRVNGRGGRADIPLERQMMAAVVIAPIWNLLGEMDLRSAHSIDAAVPSLKKEAKQVADEKRLTLASAQHPYLGRCSVLQLLPHPVLTQIVDAAVPKEGCAVDVLRHEEVERNPDKWWELKSLKGLELAEGATCVIM